GDIAAWVLPIKGQKGGFEVASFSVLGGVNELLRHEQGNSISQIRLAPDKVVYVETQVTNELPIISIELVWLVRPDPAFQQVWQKADGPVASGKAVRSWLWGPQANYMGLETYTEGQGGKRLVRYYDKSRMEVNNPNG